LIIIGQGQIAVKIGPAFQLWSAAEFSGNLENGLGQNEREIIRIFLPDDRRIWAAAFCGEPIVGGF